MGISFLLMMILIIGSSFVSERVLAAQHLIGGSQGWDVSTDFNSWASAQTFKVGDQLGLHSVVELGSESEYKKCDIGSATNSLSGGNNVVKLDKAGTRYFACGTSGHCDQGMKIKVVTLTADSTSTPNSSTPSSTPNSSTPSSTPTSDASICLSLSSLLFVIALLMISLFSGY